MGRLRLIIFVFYFFKFSYVGIGDHMDAVIDAIYEKLSKHDIKNIFLSDTELLNLFCSESTGLFQKLIEDTNADRTIAKIFFMLCELVDPCFQNNFPEVQNFLSSRDRITTYWSKIISKMVAYKNYPHVKSIQDFYNQIDFVESSMSEESTSSDEDDYYDYFDDDSDLF